MNPEYYDLYIASGLANRGVSYEDWLANYVEQGELNAGSAYYNQGMPFKSAVGPVNPNPLSQSYVDYGALMNSGFMPQSFYPSAAPAPIPAPIVNSSPSPAPPLTSGPLSGIPTLGVPVPNQPTQTNPFGVAAYKGSELLSKGNEWVADNVFDSTTYTNVGGGQAADVIAKHAQQQSLAALGNIALSAGGTFVQGLERELTPYEAPRQSGANIIGGAMKGAAQGSKFGPIGTGIGAAVGGITAAAQRQKQINEWRDNLKETISQRKQLGAQQINDYQRAMYNYPGTGGVSAGPYAKYGGKVGNGLPMMAMGGNPTPQNPTPQSAYYAAAQAAIAKENARKAALAQMPTGANTVRSSNTNLPPLDVRPDSLVRDRPVQRVIDPRAQRQAEEQAFQTLMFNKTNEWRDPNKRAAMTSGRAESVSPATYVTPAGDLQAIIESGAQIAKGNYVGGGLGAGVAAASVLLPGTIRVPNSAQDLFEAANVFKRHNITTSDEAANLVNRAAYNNTGMSEELANAAGTINTAANNARQLYNDIYPSSHMGETGQNNTGRLINTVLADYPQLAVTYNTGMMNSPEVASAVQDFGRQYLTSFRGVRAKNLDEAAEFLTSPFGKGDRAYGPGIYSTSDLGRARYYGNVVGELRALDITPDMSGKHVMGQIDALIQGGGRPYAPGINSLYSQEQFEQIVNSLIGNPQFGDDYSKVYQNLLTTFGRPKDTRRGIYDADTTRIFTGTGETYQRIVPKITQLANADEFSPTITPIWQHDWSGAGPTSKYFFQKQGFKKYGGKTTQDEVVDAHSYKLGDKALDSKADGGPTGKPGKEPRPTDQYTRWGTGVKDLNEKGQLSWDKVKEVQAARAREIYEFAKAAGHRFPEAVAAQFAEESGWGDKMSAKNNLFGIKADPTFLQRLDNAGIPYSVGPLVDTGEVIDGKNETVKARFVAFPDIETGVKGYMAFMGQPRYTAAMRATTPQAYLNELHKAGYATGKNYAQAVGAIIPGVNSRLRNYNFVYQPALPPEPEAGTMPPDATLMALPPRPVEQLLPINGMQQVDAARNLMESFAPVGVPLTGMEQVDAAKSFIGGFGARPKRQYGGKTPEYETEGGEVILADPMMKPIAIGQGKYTKMNNGGQLYKANGPSHNNGGIPTAGGDGGYVFSDALKFDPTSILKMLR